MCKTALTKSFINTRIYKCNLIVWSTPDLILVNRLYYNYLSFKIICAYMNSIRMQSTWRTTVNNRGVTKNYVLCVLPNYNEVIKLFVYLNAPRAAVQGQYVLCSTHVSIILCAHVFIICIAYFKQRILYKI